jgi:hypothetical protein
VRHAVPLASQSQDYLPGVAPHEHVESDRRAEQDEGEEERRRQMSHSLSPFLSTAGQRTGRGFRSTKRRNLHHVRSVFRLSTPFCSFLVIPAKAGIHEHRGARLPAAVFMDAGSSPA